MRDPELVYQQVEQAARAAGLADFEALVAAEDSALTRFANNGIHQNVAERSSYLSVRAVMGLRTARCSTNRLDAEGIRRVVEDSIALTRLQDEDPELLPLAEPEPAQDPERWHAATAEASPHQRASAVAEAIAVIRDAGQTAAGILSTEQQESALFNSRGVRCRYRETMARFSVTAMAGDSSGWAKASACNLADLDPVALAQTAARKARASAAPEELPPGAYTVILEPAAVLDLVGQIFFDFSATALRDERSFLSERLGTKLFGNNIDIEDNVFAPGQAGAPFDGEGVPRRRLALVENGVVKDVAYSRHAGRLAGVAPTGHGFPLPNETGEAPLNIVIRGGETSVEEMIASTARGVLVTRLWYIREVDPYDKIMTGMTRDGTFLIEGGEVTRGLRNFRFNQSVIEMLNNVEAIGPALRASGEEAFDLVAPSMKVNSFRFTEVTRF